MNTSKETVVVEAKSTHPGESDESRFRQSAELEEAVAGNSSLPKSSEIQLRSINWQRRGWGVDRIL
jgi:hypothetical protein